MSSYLEQDRHQKLIKLYKELRDEHPLFNQLIYGKQGTQINLSTFVQEKVILYLHETSPEILIILEQKGGINSFDLKKTNITDNVIDAQSQFSFKTCVKLQDLGSDITLQFSTQTQKSLFERSFKEISEKMRNIPSETDSEILKNFIKADKNRNRIMEFGELESMLIELKISAVKQQRRILKFIKMQILKGDKTSINLKQFQMLSKFLICRKQFEKEFETCSQFKFKEDKDYFQKTMSKQFFSAFLKNVQGQSPENVRNVTKQIFKTPNYRLSFTQFCYYLTSSFCNIIHENYYSFEPNTNLPFTNYFCYSSHNTYLTGNQLTSNSKAERYYEDLARGIRCVEIDCHDGSTGAIVTHGYTATNCISFEQVLEQIRFFTRETKHNHSPIIISIENHCNIENQKKMAQSLVKYFGKYLFTIKHYFEKKSLLGQVEQGILDSTPSLAELKGKIYVKCSGTYALYLSNILNDNYKEVSKILLIEETQKEQLLTEDDTKQLFFGQLSKIKNQATKQELQLLKKVHKLSPQLLIVTPMLGKGKLGKPSFWESVSISQNDIKEYFNSKFKRAEIMSHSKKGWIRSYPSGLRVSSTNYNPYPALELGVQILALNTQVPDVNLHILHHFFKKGSNSLIGYRQKPESFILQKVAQVKEFCIRPISAAKIYFDSMERKKQIPNCQIFMRFYCYSEDMFLNKEEVLRQRPYTEELKQNAFNPVFKQSVPMRVRFRCDWLAFIVVSVKDAGVGVIPLESIQKGYRHLTLYDHEMYPKQSKVFFYIK